MERTVPTTASEEIELYLRTIYSLLRSTTDVQIRTLEEVHTATNSLLHPDARKQSPDISAFIFAMLRLPAVMPDVRLVVLGQSADIFDSAGYSGLERWDKVYARARRRLCYFDGDHTLACFIASRTDIDDIIPVMTAYQIEWNKLHMLFKRIVPGVVDACASGAPDAAAALAEGLQMNPEDLLRLQTVMGSNFAEMMHRIAANRCEFHVRLLNGSMSQYWRATRMWWEAIERACPDILERPVYFISGNTHSFLNTLSGFALQVEDELVDFLRGGESEDLYQEWEGIHNGSIPDRRENLLYYTLKKYQSCAGCESLVERQAALEQRLGIVRIPSQHVFDVEAQVFDLRRLDPALFDPRISTGLELSRLAASDALLLVIDYPLGLAAYNILSKVAEHADPVLGVYVMGKAATLNGVLGDVMIPNVMHDEQSLNTYLFQNAFTAADVTPYLTVGTVLDIQKGVSVQGTFLQNARIMDVFYREGYTDIEMEAGPYLSAIYEMYRPQRHPVNEIVNLYGLGFDLSVIHYASDTPLSKGKNLGARSLSYSGMDATYAVSIAILNRIFKMEIARLQGVLS
jgi:hypothetical protein